mgnify:CR=1 FL=1
MKKELSNFAMKNKNKSQKYRFKIDMSQED